mmetsp:Transcript_18808/g.46599  ORF Transcript_18808/g.46599 Transcript_18808/m.46599 type:complete len:121 (+) Transcript_18808:304-666(+)
MFQIRYTLIALILVFAKCESFSNSAKLRYTVRLAAWSLQMPENFGTFKSTWYNEVENPTARKNTYYDDIPRDFRIVAAGSDWPSTADTVEAEGSLREESRICLNPLRRARRWFVRRKPRV